jgi:hypothetical protein
MAVAQDVRRTSSGVGSGEMTYRIWRGALWCGIVFMVVGLVSWAIVAKFLPAPHESWTADQTKQFFLDDQHRIRAGLIGYIFIGPLYVPFSLVFARIIRRIEGRDGILSQIEFFGGIGTALVTQLSGALWLTASFRTGSRSASEIQLLSDVGWFLFDMTFAVTLVQYCAIGVAVLLDKRDEPLLPRWFGWLSFAVAATFLPLLVMPFMVHGPFAWGGLFNYYVALGAFFVWILLAFVYGRRAVTRLEREPVS